MPEPNRHSDWVDRLARKSAGLPREPKPPQEKKPDDGGRSVWALAGIGIQIGGTVALFLLAGRWIDKHFGWQYGATLTMMMIGLVGSLYLLIKETRAK